MKNRIVRVIKLIGVLLISLVAFSSVYAQDINLKEVKILDKNIEIEDPIINGNDITNEINMKEVGDFVTLEITIQNNSSYDYTIDSVEDNNKNKNILLSYNYSKTDIKKNSEYKFKVTILYKNRLENVEEINLKDTKITVNLIREDGKRSSIVVNPPTGDSILKYVLLLIIALLGVVLKQKKKVFYKVLFIIPILLLPFIIFANESYKQDIIFKDIKIKGVMLPYEVTINIPNEDPIIKIVNYGDEIGELPEVDIDGYEFNGWQDDKGNEVDEHTKVTGEVEISPKLSPIIYTINYNLQGGTATGNKETYTVETDTFTLVNPSKEGYSFSGWTGSNGDSLQTEVTIYKGTTGNLSYEAHYKRTDNIPYKVIHRKQNLSLDGYDIEEEQTGEGSADTTVRPQTRQYEGFISPEEQDLLITEDGLASLTYDYNRIIYTYVVDENTSSTKPSGDYPYGTEVTITANSVPGYTFDGWSDGNTDNPRDIIVSEGTTNITPVYKANRNTPYVVIHYQMDIDGINYTEYERENKTGETDTEVTPLVKTYEGFTSPSPKTVTIKGDGTTVVEYQYRRNDITIRIDIPGEEVITKTVKYGDVIGELPTPSKEGYNFEGFEDEDHNRVDENTKVHDEITITPIFTPINYTISYDLNGGSNHSDNPSTYTIESNNITISDASREGYTFVGWTGSNGNVPSKNVVIEKGTTGNKTYKANYSKSADELNITLDTISYPYDGTAKEPGVVIKDGEVELVEGRDYTIEYSDNINAGEATVTITMTGEANPDTGATYSGEKEVHFTILAVPPLVELINTSKEYTGEPIVFTSEDVRVTPNSGGEISFKYCSDIECENEVSSIEDAGTYYVIAHVSAKGNYSQSDSEPTEITIERKGIEVPEVTTVFTYTSQDQELMTDTEQYTVSNNVAKNAGTYDVIVTPTSNYKWSDGTTTPKVVSITINPYDINNGSAVPAESYVYDGNEKEPTPSVIVPLPSSIDTTTLTSSDLDYTYENNVNAGEATINITGKGNYTGTITETFTIEKADGEIELSRTSDNIIYGTNSISVDVINRTGEIEATTTTPGVSIEINNNTINITGLSDISSGSTVEVKVKSKTSANYKEAEETYTITVSDAAITGGSVTITGVNGVGEKLTAVVEDTTPKGAYSYEWYRNNEDSTTGGTKIDGETSNEYTLTNEDIGKYIYVVVTASKQNYTPITFKDKVDAETNKTDKTKKIVEVPTSSNTCKTITYNGDSQVLTNESPEEYAYINNSGVNSGEYTVEARLEDNYMWSDYTFENKPITCVINKKNVTIKADNQTKVYDGTPLNADTTCTDKNSDLISGHLPVCSNSGSIINVGNETKVLNTVLIKQNDTDLTNNYNITKENGELSVTARDITCTSSSSEKVYDGTPLTDNRGTCTNLVTNQVATFNNTGSASNVSDTREGNNTLESVTITDQNSVNVTSNYNITKHNGTLTITRANSSCEITNNPVLYYPGDNTETITYTCTGDGELTVSSSSNVITVSNQTSTSASLTATNTGTSTITVSKAEGPNYNSTSVIKEITVNASIYHVIFNKNSEDATGSMNPQDITYGVPTTLSKNQYERSGYVFVGWNTKDDGTGTPYLDQQQVTNLAESGNVTLYAEWIEAQSMFDTGDVVNYKMKKLSGQTGLNTAITSIQKSSTVPNISQMTSDNIVSASTSNVPIYAWYDNGTIYWWSHDNVPSLNEDCSYMFFELNGLTSLDLSSFDASNATNMQQMFYRSQNLTTLVLGDNFDTSNVTRMDLMFRDCYSLTNLDLGNNFDTSNVRNMSYMFGECRSLTNLDLGDNFDTSSVTTTHSMFYNCSSLTTLDLGDNFDLRSATSIYNMFYNCSSLTNLDLGDNFDTSNVRDMSTMFYNCSSLTTLDLGNKFDTSNVSDMDQMFQNCSSLITIYAPTSFVTTNVTRSSTMFYGDTNLVGGMGTVYDSSHIDKEYAHIDGGTSNPGYFTSKTGWRFVNSQTSQSIQDQQWSYYVNGVRTESGWNWYPDLNNTLQKYYFENGIAHLGWLEYEGDYYYLSTEDEDGNGYVDAGAYRSTIKEIDNKYYRFDSEGRCLNYDQDLYLIRFDANGGIASESSRYVDQGNAVGELPTVTRDGYVFEGWWTNLTTGIEVTASTVPNSSTTYYARWSEINTILFDSNEGEFSQNITTNTIKVSDGSYYYDTTYKEPYRSGYVFIGWNDEIDGTGTSYADEQAVLNNAITLNNKTLYAEWVVAVAMFDTGNNVNIKMKKLAGLVNPSSGTEDTNVIAITRTNVRPDTSSFTSDNIVSISNATYNAPIYVWYDNGTIYWFTDDEKPELNMDASFMFSRFKGLELLELEDVDSNYTTTLSNMFNGDTGLVDVDLSSLNTSNVTSLYQMFYGATSLQSINISNWDMSNISSVQWIFDGVTGLNTVIAEDATFNTLSMNTFLRRNSLTTISVKNSNPGTSTSIESMFLNDQNLTNLDITNFDTSNVTNMSRMFSGCSSLTSIDLSSLDTSNIANISSMFYSCTSLTSINFTGFNTSKITNMESLFSFCSSLENIDLSFFRTSLVTSLRNVFNYCTSLKNLNISNWDMSNVTNSYDIFWAVNSLENIVMDNVKLSNSTYNIFNGKTSIKTISMKNSDAGSATTMNNMFYNLANLESIDLRNFDSKNVTYMGGMFSGDGKLSYLNLTNFTTTNVANMSSMFNNCSSLTALDLSSFNTSELTNAQSMFYGCTGLTNLDLSNFTTPKLTNTSYMFNGCTGLTSLDLSTFDTSKVTNFFATFQGMTNLSTLNISNWTFTNNISDFGSFIAYDTAITSVIADNITLYSNYSRLFNMLFANSGLKSLSARNINLVNVTNLSSMFSNLINLETLDFTGLDTTGVTNLYSMFSYCQKLTSLDLRGFDTSSATNISSMFSNCTLLETIDISSFDTSNVTDMNYTFYRCPNLTTIYATEKFVTTKITDGYNKAYAMFSGDTKLVGGLGTPYDSRYTYHQYAHLDGGTSNPGYFTAGTGWRFANHSTSQNLLDQEWSYYEDGEIIESGFRLLPDLYGQEQKYYFINGIAHLGWLNIGDDYYYLSTEDDDGNGYVNAGAYRSISKVINGKSYAFDSEGRCLNYSGDDMYTVIYNANGGTASYSTKNLGPDESLGTLPTATREGYVFDGWWTTIDGGTQIDSNVVPNAGVTYYAHWAKINTVSFNSNAGEFSPSVTTNTIIYSNTYMDSTSYLEPTRNGYIFIGWNTETEGSGTSYLDEQAVLNSIYSLDGITLYAQWIEAISTLDTGSNVNVKLKRLAGNSSATYSSSDTNITSIQRTTIRPDISSMTSDNIISNSTSTVPVYAWYDNGTIYYYSDSETIFLNQDSSCLFVYLTSLTSLDLSYFDTSKVIYMNSMFSSCSSLPSLDLSSFDTSKVIDMSYMFNGCGSLTSLDLSSFDTSKVTDMSYMFLNCSSLTSLDLSTFDTSEVENMFYMFSSCRGLPSLDLSSFDTSKVTLMTHMFLNCSSLTSLDLSTFDTSEVKDMYGMFDNCRDLPSLDLSSFDTSKVTSMTYMFYNCRRLATIYVSNSFVTTSVTSSSYMFGSMSSSLRGGSGTTWSSSNPSDKTYAHIDGGTSNPGYFTNKTTINISFDSNGGTGTMNNQVVQYNVATPLNTNTYTRTGYVFNGWNTKADGTGTSYSDGGNITATTYTRLYAQWREAEATFLSGSYLNSRMRSLAGENTSVNYETTKIKKIQRANNLTITPSSDNVVSSSASDVPIYMWYDSETIYYYSEASKLYFGFSMEHLFWNFASLNYLDISNISTSKVTNMNGVFYSCKNLTSLDVSTWDTSKVESMSSLFCNLKVSSLNVSNFDTSQVTNMSDMFAGCSNLTSLNLSNFNTSKVIRMNSMFEYCSSLTSLNLSSFNTSNVENMSSIFRHTEALTSLNISSFNTSKVISMSNMFNKSKLSSINFNSINGWDTSKVENMSAMFANMSNLTSLDLRKFNTSSLKNTDSMFASLSNITTIDLSSFDTSNVTSMRYMFYDCKVKTVYASNKFVTSNVTDSTGMFTGATSIVGVGNTTYNSSYTDKTYARTTAPGYFTYKAAPSASVTRFINAFSSLNAKISKYVLGIFVVIALILSTILLIIRSIKKRKIRKY